MDLLVPERPVVTSADFVILKKAVLSVRTTVSTNARLNERWEAII